MRVLTIKEPWASLIGIGKKKYETRSWYTSYRGELYIHAGKSPISKKDTRRIQGLEYLENDNLYYGNIFLKCKLIDCVLIDEKFADSVKKSDPVNFFCGNYSVGRYAWILDDVTYITPIEANGHLSIWKYDE